MRPFHVFEYGPDSLGVLDYGNGRVSMMDRDLVVARTVRLPGPTGRVLPLLDNRTVLAAGSYRVDSDSNGRPLHELDLDSPAASIVRSFGVPPGEPVWPGPRLMALAHDGDVWVGVRSVYRFERWGADGTFRTVHSPERDWLHDIEGQGLGTPDHPPSSFVIALDADEHGSLWVYSLVPDLDWKDAWADVEWDPSVELNRSSGPIRRKLLDTVVEVFRNLSTPMRHSRSEIRVQPPVVRRWMRRAG